MNSSLYLTVNRGIALWRKPGVDPTDIRANISEAIGDLEKQETVDGVIWTNVSFLEDGDPAPEGWIPESTIDREFIPELTKDIDRNVFVEDCLLAAWNTGANTHFLAAWADFESGVCNILEKRGGIQLIGPFQFSVAAWDRYRNSPEQQVMYERSRIFRPDCQCDIAGIATKRAIEAFKIGNMDLAPRANELLLALRIGVTSALLAISSKDTTKIDGLIAKSLEAEGVENKDAALANILALNADILTDGNEPPRPITVRQVFEKINARLQVSLAAVRPLIGAIDPDLLQATSPAEHSGQGGYLRYSGSEEERQVYGHLVLRMQQSLGRSLTSVENDMEFGSETATALNVWQTQKGRSLKNKITARQWAELTNLPRPTLRDYCLQLTASFEGHGFNDTITGDGDGAVMTWGYIGFTFLWGHVQAVINLAENANRDWLVQAFGTTKAAELRTILALPLAEQIVWGRAVLLNKDKSVEPAWELGFKSFGAIEGVRVAQLQHCEALWSELVGITSRYNLSERLTIALCYDILVQNGPTKLASLLKSLHRQQTESALRNDIVAQLQGPSAKRKAIIAAGFGRKTADDKLYQLSDWGLVADEEDESNHQELGTVGPLENQEFSEYLLDQLPEIAGFFKPAEFLVKGSNLSGLNTDPPRRFWKNILATGKIITIYRRSLPDGHKIIFNSVYRSPPYNKQIGGAKNSQHMLFNAIDFRVIGPNPGAPAQWAKILRQMRAEGRFKGGVGLYDTFVHLDTRGTNQDF